MGIISTAEALTESGSILVATGHSRRKLAVILHADVVGSTGLVQRNESLAHERIRNAFSRFSRTIEAYGGITHEVRGDALLAEFNRASDAVAASLAFQDENTGYNASLDDDIRAQVRIGLSLGEVIIADGTLTGPDVVLAQRLEQLAQPGGVVVSQSVYQSVPRRLPFEWRDLGDQTLKGFNDPVRVYSAAIRAGVDLPAPESSHTARAISLRQWLIGIAALLLLVAVGFSAWHWRRIPVGEPVSIDGMAFPLPDKPSIAVLPFENMGENPEHEYFADGITEDLITDLSKISGLFVIARNSTFAYKSQPRSNRQIAKELGVRYVLEGSVRRRGDRIRINSQLTDVTTGGHVWADRYDGSLNDIFTLQDKVTSNIVAVLAVQLTAGEQERRAQRAIGDAEAYDLFLKGWEHYLRQTPGDFRSAISYFKKAVEVDASYTHAYAAMAATYWEIWKRLWHESVGLQRWHDARGEAEQFLAMAAKQPTPLALQIGAKMSAQMGNHDDAVAKAERAIALDPNDADSYVTFAGTLNLIGRPGQALKSVERAMRLNPHYPPSYLFQLGLAQFGMERFEDAAASLEKATTLNPDDRWSYRLLLATYGLLGRSDDATRVLNAIEQRATRQQESLDPLTVRSSAFWHPFENSRDAEQFATGLRRAGVPD